jgi:acyl-CoA synthetase (AMP-forming)/AMP-acid ligase II
LLLDVRAAYHFSPLDTRTVAKLARMRSATLLLATPTFLRAYLRRCEPEELSSLEVVVAGAEKLPIPLCDAFEKKFGIRPVEGYGTTEFMRFSGGYAVTLECGTHDDPKAADIGYAAIRNTLAQLQLVDAPLPPAALSDVIEMVEVLLCEAIAKSASDECWVEVSDQD